MGEVKHTAGVWIPHFDGNRWFVRLQEDALQFGYVEICEVNGPEHEDEANARLIAAAPELLEAAKEAIQELGRIGHQDNPEFPEFQKLCAAVDKAEGDQ